MNGRSENGLNELPQEVFALIVGGGPIGLVTALSLAKYGYHSLVLERHAERLGQPKAHVLSFRSLEIFRQMNIDLSPLVAKGLPRDEGEVIRFASSMSGIEFGSLDFKQDPEHVCSPELVFNVPQPALEEFLLEKALETGRVTYVRMFEWKDCVEELGKKIISRILCRRTNTLKTVKSKYLLACDGAGARSRAQLNIEFQPVDGGKERVLHYASVHFRADLSHKKPGLLWFILRPDNTGVFIAYNRKSSWVFFLGYDPALQPKESLNSEWFKARVFEVSLSFCRLLVMLSLSFDQAVGHPLEDYEELGITIWTTSPKLADVYRSPTIKNAFLAGDSAHSFPPTGGLGVNTGIGDVHNLVWKIHAVEQVWARDTLLDTVTGERRPVALANGVQSTLNEEKIFKLAVQVLRPRVSAEQLMADPDAREDVQIAIDNNRDHFHCMNLHIGYQYGRNALKDRDVDDYKKVLVSGARLPHVWLSSSGKRISSLDLVSALDFTILTSKDFTLPSTYKVNNVPVVVKQLGVDFFDEEGEWTELLAQIKYDFVLVRPDQHIVDTFRTPEKANEGLKRYLDLS